MRTRSLDDISALSSPIKVVGGERACYLGSGVFETSGQFASAATVSRAHRNSLIGESSRTPSQTRGVPHPSWPFAIHEGNAAERPRRSRGSRTPSDRT